MPPFLGLLPNTQLAPRSVIEETVTRLMGGQKPVKFGELGSMFGSVGAGEFVPTVSMMRSPYMTGPPLLRKYIEQAMRVLGWI